MRTWLIFQCVNNYIRDDDALLSAINRELFIAQVRHRHQNQAYIHKKEKRRGYSKRGGVVVCMLLYLLSLCMVEKSHVAACMHVLLVNFFLVCSICSFLTGYQVGETLVPQDSTWFFHLGVIATNVNCHVDGGI